MENSSIWKTKIQTQIKIIEMQHDLRAANIKKIYRNQQRQLKRFNDELTKSYDKKQSKLAKQNYLNSILNKIKAKDSIKLIQLRKQQSNKNLYTNNLKQKYSNYYSNNYQSFQAQGNNKKIGKTFFSDSQKLQKVSDHSDGMLNKNSQIFSFRPKQLYLKTVQSCKSFEQQLNKKLENCISTKASSYNAKQKILNPQIITYKSNKINSEKNLKKMHFNVGSKKKKNNTQSNIQQPRIQQKSLQSKTHLTSGINKRIEVSKPMENICISFPRTNDQLQAILSRYKKQQAFRTDLASQIIRKKNKKHN